MAGQFILSFDFELMWGVRDHRSTAEYGDAILGGREAIPKILALFKEFEISATWATVGFLFARSKRDIIENLPETLPDYDDPRLSPYHALDDEVGEDEDQDPYHFAPSIIDQIQAIDGQEISTHTFSHFYCMEAGATIEAFRADLLACKEIARRADCDMKSIVFPRNQTSDGCLDVCREVGITTFRGNRDHFAYRSAAKDIQRSLPSRLYRLVDGAFPLSGSGVFQDVLEAAHLGNIPASHFLRPVSKRQPAYSRLHTMRICADMTRAARTGGRVHLWNHPHNFGRNIDANIGQLRDILLHFKSLQEEYGMVSLNMKQADDLRRSGQ
ncbi:MAG: polysaccharide deacetylase [Pseudomonadota bacterium]